jgi:hypothetical protein
MLPDPPVSSALLIGLFDGALPRHLVVLAQKGGLPQSLEACAAEGSSSACATAILIEPNMRHSS